MKQNQSCGERAEQTYEKNRFFLRQHNEVMLVVFRDKSWWTWGLQHLTPPCSLYFCLLFSNSYRGRRFSEHSDRRDKAYFLMVSKHCINTCALRVDYVEKSKIFWFTLILFSICSLASWKHDWRTLRFCLMGLLITIFIYFDTIERVFLFVLYLHPVFVVCFSRISVFPWQTDRQTDI